MNDKAGSLLGQAHFRVLPKRQFLAFPDFCLCGLIGGHWHTKTRWCVALKASDLIANRGSDLIGTALYVLFSKITFYSDFELSAINWWSFPNLPCHAFGASLNLLPSSSLSSILTSRIFCLNLFLYIKIDLNNFLNYPSNDQYFCQWVRLWPNFICMPQIPLLIQLGS